MSQYSRTPYITEEDYLQAEAAAELKHEYVDGTVFAMTGASDAHNLINMNLSNLIYMHLQGSPCMVYSNEMKIKIESLKSYYYPDLFVTCEPFEAKSVFKQFPTLIVEILSPGTSAIDRREKLVAYKKIGSLVEYVIVFQDRQRIEVLRRISSDEWETFVLTSGDELALQSLPNGVLTVPLSAVYKGYSPPSRVKEPEAEYNASTAGGCAKLAGYVDADGSREE